MRISHLTPWILIGLAALRTLPGQAQSITLDGTLGPARTLQGVVYEIEQSFGISNQANLFHSFSQFNLDSGEIAVFNSGTEIHNIFSRVTGGGSSTIDGLITTTSNSANLFLINPNGILFGPNARLEIGSAIQGSFVATSLDGLIWPDSRQFDAVLLSDSENLLKISGNPNGFITSQRLVPEILLSGTNLRVAEGQSLILLGGDITAIDSQLSVNFPMGGKIELAGIAQSGIIPFDWDDSILSLELPEDVKRSNLRLINTLVDVRAENNGALAIYGNNIEVIEGSLLLAGLSGSSDIAAAQAGELRIDAQGRFNLQNGSLIANILGIEGVGNAGDISITAATVELSDIGIISASILGEGRAGNISITASQRVLVQDEGSGAFSNILSEGSGEGGTISVETPVLEVVDGAQIGAVTVGNGRAGNISISATEHARFQNAGGVLSNIQPGGTGQGGTIVIETPVLEILDGGQLISRSDGVGEAGNVSVSASKEVLLQGTSIDGQFSSSIFSGLGPDGIGQGGDIVIKTPRLEVVEGGQLISATLGQGDAGKISIPTSDSVLVQGQTTDGRFSSTIASSVGGDFRFDIASGEGGDIIINTAVLEILDTAQVSASTRGMGNAGMLEIVASDRIKLDGTLSALLTDNGRIGASNAATGAGNDIVLSTPKLVLTNGSFITAQTGNDQPGGDITLNLETLDVLEGGHIFTTSDGRGNAGDIRVNATNRVRIGGTRPPSANPSPLPSENSTLSVSSTATGTTGNILIRTPNLLLADQGQIVGDSNTAIGGNLGFEVTRALTLSGNSLLSASAGRAQGAGDGGNITIDTPFLIGFPGNNSDIIANAFSGTGGNIDINADAILNFQINPEPDVDLLRQNPTNDISASSQFGSRGVLNLAGLDIDPSQGATELPANLLATAEQISRRCAGDRATPGQSQFFITGTGGRLPRPRDLPITAYPTGQIQSIHTPAVQRTMAAHPLPIQEASTWSYNNLGEVVLQTGIHPRFTNGICARKNF